ncbi:MAG TPA: porphobilinogen synthase [Syntrophomonadaceae bacterium]|nr:porphobilinogen synthase [Syntrophomonadaceae bacterium]HOQ08805.1 porphobilinogen synthase [Syntrophomonadaceae bacterium]HPU47775.1 porphobilinogen synthase [Syntrophomonadaceae bacterium]
MAFPSQRLRRLRSTPTLRNMVRETVLTCDDLIYPLFVVFGQNKKIPISSMPGVFQYSVDRLGEPIQQVAELGVPAVLLFGIPETKDALGSSAWQEDGVVQQAIRKIKELSPQTVVITDVCMCEYTDHGHCGALDEQGRVINDATLDLLAKEALSHAEAGCDMVAPSDMMDGRVGAIRKALDDHGFSHLPIMSYAAKFSSALYGPFREAAESAPQFGDRKTYQMDGANRLEALREVELDIEEGADIVMVKPALAYLDIIREVKDTFGYPTAAYHVSGEYAMLKAAAANGWLDEERVTMEILTSIKRAGADMIITYAALDAARWLKG